MANQPRVLTVHGYFNDWAKVSIANDRSIRLAVESRDEGPEAVMYMYLSPDQAKDLAVALIAVAVTVEQDEEESS